MTSPVPEATTNFGILAGRYDELRPADELWHEAIEALVRAGDLRGRRVLDVGCGTGRLAALLAERHGCRVWAVDPSAEMLAAARARLPREAGVKLASAESLPFRERCFERVTMTLVLHHVDRRRALPEIRRVLAEGGRFAALTFDPAHFPGYYLNRFFPSFLAIDSARFPPGEAIERELRDAGFVDVQTVPLSQTKTVDRETALAKIRGRHISTFQLISDDEYASGLARAERELPETIAYELHWLVVVADR